MITISTLDLWRALLESNFSFPPWAIQMAGAGVSIAVTFYLKKIVSGQETLATGQATLVAEQVTTNKHLATLNHSTEIAVLDIGALKAGALITAAQLKVQAKDIATAKENLK